MLAVLAWVGVAAIVCIFGQMLDCRPMLVVGAVMLLLVSMVVSF